MSVKRIKQFVMICSVIIIIEAITLISILVWKSHAYNSVEKNISNERYDLAREQLDNMSFFKDEKKYKELESIIEEEEKYQYAVELLNQGRYEEAADILLEMRDRKDVDNLYEQAINNQSSILQKFYDEACKLEDSGDYASAKEKFESLEDFKDSKEKAKECEDIISRLELANYLSAGTCTVAAIDDNTNVVRIAVGNGNIHASTIKEIEQWQNIVSVDCMGYYMCGLSLYGKVFVQAFPGAEAYDMSSVTELDSVIQVSTGSNFVAALTNDNRVICAGKYVKNGIIDTSGWEDVIQIATGRNFVVGLTKKHELLITGNNIEKLKEEYDSKKADWENVVEIDAGGGESGKNYFGAGHIVGKTADGRAVAIGDNRYNQCDVIGYNHVVKIVAGDWHTVLLFDDGKVLNVGKKDGMPSQYASDSNSIIKQISAGCGVSVYLNEEGKLSYNGFDIGNGIKEAIGWSGLKTEWI